MEHLALPAKPIRPTPIIPLYSTELYDGGPFLQYMTRHPYALSSVTHEEIRIRYQRWLFFGLLREFLGQYFTEDEYIRWDDERERSVITTQVLPLRLACWQKEYVKSLSANDPQLGHFGKCLGMVAFTLCFLSMHFQGIGEGFGDQIDSIASIAETLERAIWEYHQSFIRDETRDWLHWSNQGQKDVLDQTVKGMISEGGWCANEISRARDRFKTFEAWYYFQRLRLNPDTTQHRSCDAAQCRVITAPNSKCVPRHTSNCGVHDCGWFGVNSQRLVDIYRAGAIPCVELSLSSGSMTRGSNTIHDNMNISIESIDINDPLRPPYVAISHVWSQGAGNSESNSLPVCQISALWAIIESWIRLNRKHLMSRAICFWIDTICCPHEQGEGKDIALSKMTEIYSNADIVLVNDQTLRDWYDDKAKTVEYGVRLFFSPWMRRLWTTQEVLLAGTKHYHKVIVMFGRMSRDWVNIRLKLSTKQIGRSLAGTLIREFEYLQKDFWDSLKDFHILNRKFATLVHITQYRSTTVPTDEALVLGNILGFPSQLFIGFSQEDTMCRFWKEVTDSGKDEISGFPVITKDIIFISTPKLTTPGYRWAPRSLLDHGSTNWYRIFATPYAGSDSAFMTPHGLLASYPGIKLRKLPEERHLCLYGLGSACTEGNAQMWVELPDGSWRGTQEVRSKEDLGHVTYRELLRDYNLCLIMCLSEAPAPTYGLWVHLESESDGIKHVRILRTTMVKPRERERTQLMSVAKNLATVVWCELRQKWPESGQDPPAELMAQVCEEQIRKCLSAVPSLHGLLEDEENRKLTQQEAESWFTKTVHYFAHIGILGVEELDDDTKWCLT